MPDEQPGLRPIGSLMSKIAPTPPSEATRPARPATSRPISSSTSPTGRAEHRRTATGTGLGKPGSAIAQRAASLPDFSMVLAERTPAEIDLELTRWLPLSVARCVVTKMYLGSDPARLCGVEGYELRGYDGREREEALEILRALCRPASHRECLKEVARLKALTAAARVGEQDLEIQLEVFAEELERYPMDVVRSACRDWPRCPGGKWWPSWAELRDMCDERFLKRKALLVALERY